MQLRSCNPAALTNSSNCKKQLKLSPTPRCTYPQHGAPEEILRRNLQSDWQSRCLPENKTSKSNGGSGSGNVAKHINHKNFKCAKLVCRKAAAAGSTHCESNL